MADVVLFAWNGTERRWVAIDQFGAVLGAVLDDLFVKTLFAEWAIFHRFGVSKRRVILPRKPPLIP